MSSFFSELRRRNVIRVAIAYGIVGWVLTEIASVVFEAFEFPLWGIQLFISFVALGFPMALLFAWAFEMTPGGLKREKDVDRSQSITPQTGRKLDFIIIGTLALALIVVVVDNYVLDREPGPEIVVGTDEVKTVAVLPFVNMSDDPANEYFSDGIAEELLNVLVRIEGLRVSSRTSSFAFKDKDVSIPMIAEQLNVDHILEGSVRKSGNKVRVTAQLIDVKSDTHLWSASYDRELEDIFVIQDEIADNIVEALKVALGTGVKKTTEAAGRPTESLEAYELFMQGRYVWQRRGEDNIRNSIDLFEQAIELDPDFARAHSALATAYTTLPGYSNEPDTVAFPLAEAAARKALSIDESLAEPHAVLADITRWNRRWAEAERHYKKAIKLEPNNATAHMWYVELLGESGRLEDALAEARKAQELDPVSPPANGVLALCYALLGNDEDAFIYASAALTLGHLNGQYAPYIIYSRRREFEKAIEAREELIRAFGGDPVFVRPLIEGMEDPAKQARALEIMAGRRASGGNPGDGLVRDYLFLDQMDLAFETALENVDTKNVSVWFQMWSPELSALRRDPRFLIWADKLGLVDYWRETGPPDLCEPVGNTFKCR